MAASFFLTIREGMEAALIIGVLLGSVNTLKYSRGRIAIWLGVGAALLGSFLAGLGLNLLGASFQGRAEEIFEGVTMLLAAIVLTWMIFWLKNRAREHNQKLKDDLEKAVSSQGGFALFSLAFLAIIREGVELALFLTAVAVDQEGPGVWIGAAFGLAVAAALGMLLYRSLVRLNISRFFQFTSLILILFAAGLAAHGAHELIEAALIPPLVEPLWDINHILDENSWFGQTLKALLGYNGDPSLTEVLVYLLYFGIIRLIGFNFRDLLISNQRQKEVPV